MIPILLGGLGLALSWWIIWRLVTRPEVVDSALSRAGGHFLEIGIYRDHPRPMLKSLGALNRAGMRLCWVLLPPSLAFTLPLLALGYLLWHSLALRPPVVAEAFLVSVTGPTEQVALEVPAELAVEVGPARVGGEGQTSWRLRANQEGRFPIKVRTQSGETSKEVLVGQSWSPVWPSSNYSGGLTIEVDYPERTIWMGDTRIHWALALFLAFLVALPLTQRWIPAWRKET